MIVIKLVVQILAEISVFRSPEPKKSLKMMSVSMYVVVIVWR